MSKKNKITRMDQYRDILESRGKRMEDCKNLAFDFDSNTKCALFHYELMRPNRPVYHIFDSLDRRVIITVPKDPENEKKMVELAESYGGKKTIPILI